MIGERETETVSKETENKHNKNNKTQKSEIQQNMQHNIIRTHDQSDIHRY